jgi:hypothetical protein
MKSALIKVLQLSGGHQQGTSGLGIATCRMAELSQHDHTVVLELLQWF